MRPKIKTSVLVVIGCGVVVGGWRSWQRLARRLTAGPMVQRVGRSGFVVVWRTAEAGGGRLVVMDGDRVVMRVPARLEGDQYVASAMGLASGHVYAYEIWQVTDSGERKLGGPWRCKTNEGPSGSFRLVGFGDSGTGSWGQYRLARQMAGHRPDLIIHTGDLVYKRGEARDYPSKFFEPYASMLTSVGFMPVMGNHDYVTERGRPLLDTFVLPQNGPKGTDAERHYWFDYGCARFAAIDSNVTEAELQGRVSPWLLEVFGSAGDRWRFAYFHHPPYTCCTKRGGNKGVLDNLVPALEASGVDVVFCGHNHLYERSKPILAEAVAADGIVYIVTGAGGARLYAAKPKGERPAYTAVAYDEDLSFTLVDASPGALLLQQIDVKGQVVDRWELQRGMRSGATGKIQRR